MAAAELDPAAQSVPPASPIPARSAPPLARLIEPRKVWGDLAHGEGSLKKVDGEPILIDESSSASGDVRPRLSPAGASSMTMPDPILAGRLCPKSFLLVLFGGLGAPVPGNCFIERGARAPCPVSRPYFTLLQEGVIRFTSFPSLLAPAIGILPSF